MAEKNNTKVKPLSIVAVRMRQKDETFYLFKMLASEVRKIVYVLPKSKDNPEALERRLIPRKARDIGEYLDSTNAFFPNSIVVNLKGTFKIEETKFEEIVLITFPEVRIEEGDYGETEGKYGYVVDGQHRLYGFKYSKKKEDFDLPVVAFVNAPKERAYKSFADINELQTKVPELVVQNIRYEIGDIKNPDKFSAVQLVHDLNYEKDSPLKDKIRIFQDDKQRWVNAPSLTRWIAEIVGAGGTLQGFLYDEQKRILKNYFRAFSNVFDYAWKDRPSHIINKAMGFYLQCQLFDRVYRRCQFYEHSRFETENFVTQLNGLQNLKISLDPNLEPIPLDWKSSTMGQFSSGKGLKLLRDAILRSYQERIFMVS